MDSISSIAASAMYGAALRQAAAANAIASAYHPDSTASPAQSVGNYAAATAAASGGSDTVNISREAVNMLANDNNYRANVKTLQSADDMTRQLLSILG